MDEKILSHINHHKKITTQDVGKLFGISRQAAHKKLHVLTKNQALVKIGGTKTAFYTLPSLVTSFGHRVTLRLKNINLKEHEVLHELTVRFPQLLSLSENVRSIFTYTFSEMLNNAIEHSLSKNIVVTTGISEHTLEFVIADSGIGVFRNVRQKYQLASEIEAIQELMKGKTTTAPQAHSGEGIFFTSKIADQFSLESYGYRFLVDNTLPDLFIQNEKKPFKGTKVTFRINEKNKKHLIDLFQQYESDDGEHGFEKTKIHIKLYTYGTMHVSRSQARRILTNLEKFKHVILDFDQVPSIGQAFADEIFRVFQTSHPHIVFEIRHANEAVQFMMNRVRKE